MSEGTKHELKNIIQFVPRKLDKNEPAISPAYQTKRCEHRAKSFSYSERRREVYCRECDEKVDTFEAFRLLGAAINGILWRHKGIEEARKKQELLDAVREAYQINREFGKPLAKRMMCATCSLPMVKIRGRDYWRCFQCNRGGCYEYLLSEG